MIALIAFLSSLGAVAAPADTSGGWERLYTVPTRAQWLSSVWLAADGWWFAGGKGLLVSGRDKEARTTDLPGDVVYAFGEDASGRVLAVGLKASVWEHERDSFKRVHGHAGAAPRGKAAYRDLLYGIGYLDPAAPTRLLAYGPNDLIVSRDGPNGGWQPTRDAALASRTLVGPKVDLPRGCRHLIWHWLSRTDGFLACRDRRAFVIADGVPRPLGRLPAACAGTVSRVARDGEDLFASCGQTPRLWSLRGGSGAWAAVKGAPRNVAGLHARGGCVLVATAREVWRSCGASRAAGQHERAAQPLRTATAAPRKHAGPTPDDLLSQR